MEAIKKITRIRNSVIRFNELKKWDDQEVEVIILPLFYTDREIKDKKAKLLEYEGVLEGEFCDTSERVDELIYDR